MNLVDHPIEAVELRVSGIADFSPLRVHRSTATLTVLRGQHYTAFLHPTSSSSHLPYSA
jgi:hypothetical protein